MRKAAPIVCIALLVVTVGASLGCGGGGSGSSGMTPAEVADAYMRASLNRDADAVWELMSKTDQEAYSKEVVAGQLSQLESMDLDYSVGEETIDGDTATVQMTLIFTDPASGEKQEYTDSMYLVNEGGEWKVTIGSSSQNTSQ
ncbi:MAG: hypothetical protein AB1384_08110 [Actinomycetota bacterium]